MKIRNINGYLNKAKQSAIWFFVEKHKQTFFLAAMLAISFLLLFVFATFLEKQTKGWMYEVDVKDSAAQADTIARVLDELAITTTSENINAFVAKIGKNQDFRITVLDATGLVLADSWLSLDEVKLAKNHANRKEITESSLNALGISTRHSNTVNKDLIYVAKQYDEKNFSGYIRIATPSSVVENDIAALHSKLMQTIFMVFLIFLWVNYYVFQHIKREKKLLNEQQKTLACLDKQSENSALIQKFGQALTTCESRDELVSIISKMGSFLFGEHTIGALAISPPSLDTIEVIASWGENWPGEHRFAPRDCWGFRRGGVHLSKSTGMEISCNHLEIEHGDAVQCVLLQSQGISLGALHIGASEDVFNSSSFQNKIYTVSEQLCLTIANLNLRVKLEQQAIRDPLTALYNRRYLDDSFSRELKRAERKESSLAVIMIDIDHFKVFNDTYGHDAGDYVIKKFSQVLSNAVREEDISCRYGGEEFTLVLNEIDIEVVVKRAEALLEETRRLELQLHNQSLGQITVSLGIAMFPQHGRTQQELIKAADEALYHAKEAGRNQLKLAGDIVTSTEKLT